MLTRRGVIVVMAAWSMFAATSCAQQSRSKAPAADQLAIGDVPGVMAPPAPIAGEDSGTTLGRKSNLPKFGDYVYVTELPEAIEKAKPEYPAAMRGSGVGGFVIVQALVLADGTVGDTHIVKSIPPLDEAAATCVRKWKFKPAENKEGPTAVWVAIPIEFVAEPR